LLGITD